LTSTRTAAFISVSSFCLFVSFRGDAKRRTRNLEIEIPGSRFVRPGMTI